MKVLDVIKPYKAMVQEEILEETRLSTDFNIGFELEGICDSNDPDLEDAGSRPSYHSGNRARGGSAALNDKLTKALNMGKGNILSIDNKEIASLEELEEIEWDGEDSPISWIHWADNKKYKDKDEQWYVIGEKIVWSPTSDVERLGEEVGELQGHRIKWFTDKLKDLNIKDVPQNLSINQSKIESDGSLHVNDTDTTGHAWTFEWGSPIIRFNPTNINKIKNFLTHLKDMGVYTNESCGFHTHISFDNMTRDDAKWILFCIANDDNLLDEVSYLRVPGEEPIKFFGQYAKDDWFRELKVHGSIDNWHFNESTDTKYLIVRIHPEAGTLEWRGPRDFINDGEKPELIAGYLNKLYKLVLNIAKIVDEKEYNGFKRKEVLEKMTVGGKFNTAEQKISSLTADKLKDLVLEKPQLLITLKPSKLEKLLNNYPNRLTSTGYYQNRNDLEKIWDKIPTANKKLLIMTAHNEGNLDFIASVGKTNNGKYDVVTSTLLIDEYINHGDGDRLLRNTLDDLTIEDSKILEKIYNSGISKRLVLQVLGKFPKLISMKILTQIANSSERYVLSSFPSLPVKIQRILIRKNPYNVQYINNPDPSIIDELTKKYGDDIKDYILGVL